MSNHEHHDWPGFADYIVVRATAEFAVSAAEGFVPEELRTHLMQTNVLPGTSTPDGFGAYFASELQPAVVAYMQRQRGEGRQLPEYAWTEVPTAELAARVLLLGGTARRPARVLTEEEFWTVGPKTTMDLRPLARPAEEAASSPPETTSPEPERLAETGTPTVDTPSPEAELAAQAVSQSAAAPPAKAAPVRAAPPQSNKPPAAPPRGRRRSFEPLPYVPRPARTPIIAADEPLIRRLVDNLLQQATQQKAPVPYDGLLSAKDRQDLGGDKLRQHKIDDILNELALRNLIAIAATGKGKQLVLLVRPTQNFAMLWRQQSGRVLASLRQPRRRS